jgi:nitrogen-specific signal transduction histidine kinase/CheY-like chemotaxis protein
LRDSYASLERQRTDELADANERIRTEVQQREQAETILRHAQRLDMLGQLTGSIAHDFNNLLAIILGNLDMLRRRLGTDVDPKIARNVENAFHGARRATSLTRQLLSFSRRQSLKPKPLALDRLFVDLAGLLKQSIGEKIIVETDFSPDTWPVYVDQGELEAALLNLAMNGRDAMPKGGVLTVACKNAPAAASHGSDFVAITVKDTGQGMSDKVRQYAFEPFFTTKQVGEGTGLGLAQVYGFSKQAGGDVRVDSAMGVGTTVTLLLPRYTGPAEVVEKDTAAAPAPAGRATSVLVVEDNILVRAQTVDMLKELGHAVAEAGSASDALELLAARDDITLLLTDVGLPGGMDGTILAERALGRKPTLQVLLTTGYAMTNPRLAQTRFPVLPKPYTFASLSGALQALQKAV